ncbi:MAG TPA: tryptophan-rich sensory protein [Candidatus Limnocylindria bacterium]|nr:tryptophan-rich sensory protein [Candidatus Limnocylindria bacterium]
MSTKTKAWLNLALYFLTIGVNALGAFGVINGMSQREVSDKYPTLITPSPFTFSIWSVIYLLLLAALLWMALRSEEPHAARLIERISVPFWSVSALNILWIVAFSYELVGLSTLFILALVVCLAWLVLRIPRPEVFMERVNSLGFGLYTGWLVIATVVNVAAFLVQIGWDGFGIAAATWAVIILVVSFAVAMLILLRLQHAAVPVPLAWAYFGIWQAHRAGGAFNNQYPTIGIVALVLAGAYLAVAVYKFVRNDMCSLPRSRAANAAG